MTKQSIEPDTNAAIGFLTRWTEVGPWTLTAIVPDSNSIATQTFRGREQVTLMRRWINERQGTANLYFSVNPPNRDMNIKAMKVDIAALVALHVDLDPRIGEDIDIERERALKLLREFNPPPTVIIDSGGGVQGFWRLSEPEALDGTEEAAQEVERYNLQIELMLKADSCHNVDRIMRLPGTINLPNKRKREKGRQPRLATVVEAHWDRVYELRQFTKAPRVQGREATAAQPSTRVKLSGNLPVVDLEALPPAVSLRTKMLIVQGTDPDDPTKYGSRSEVMWAVACELVRAGVDDDTIAAILLDRDLAVSAHVLAQPRPQQYVARQIQRAREFAIDPMLQQLNERHFVVEDHGGKVLVCSEAYNPAMRRTKLSKQSFAAFRERYLDLRIKVGEDKDGNEVTMPAAEWWLRHPSKRKYLDIVFAPNQELPNYYNLWQGFAVEAIPGDCGLFLAHIRENICGGNEEHYQYLVKWMARCVQHPDSPGEVAVVMRGPMGAGKSLFAKQFGAIFGRHFLQVSDSKHLVGSFNAHLRDCVVLFGDEAFYAGDKKHASVLKTLVTEELLVVEGKGVDAEVSPNFIHLILASNSDWLVPAGPQERRYFVLDVTDKRQQQSAYFAAVLDQLNTGGREALLHYLLTLDLTGFDVRAFPRTAALQDQKEHNWNTEEQWWFEKLSDGTVFINDEWPRSIHKQNLFENYKRFAEDQRRFNRVTPHALHKFLKSYMPEGFPRQVQRVGQFWEEDEFGHRTLKRGRTYYYDFAPLEECRAIWAKKWGEPVGGWPQPRIEEEPETSEAPF